MRPVFTSSSRYAVCERQTRGNLLFTSSVCCVRSLSLPNYVIVTYPSQCEALDGAQGTHLHGRHIPQRSDEGRADDKSSRAFSSCLALSNCERLFLGALSFDNENQRARRGRATRKYKQTERSVFNANLGSAFRLNSTRNHSLPRYTMWIDDGEFAEKVFFSPLVSRRHCKIRG